MAYNDVILADTPVGYWRLNESSGTVVNDLGSGASTGAYVSTPALDQNALIFEPTGRSVDFEETSNQLITFTNNPLTDLINGAAKVTVEGWVNIESFTTQNTLLSCIIDAGSSGISLRTEINGDITILARSVAGDSAQILSVPWNITSAIAHIVGIVDFTNKALYLFQDGIQIGKFSATFANATYTKGTPTTADSLAGLPGLTQLMDGRLAEVALYNKALTPLQTRQHHNAGIAKGFDKQILSHSPVLYLPLDEISGDSKDRVNQNNGVHTSTTQNIAGGLVSSLNTDDKSVEFDGLNSKIEITAQTALDNVFDAGGSISLWMDPDTDGEGNVGRILHKGPGWLLQTREESAGSVKLRFQLNCATTDGIWATTATEVTLNEASHVVVTLDSDGTPPGDTVLFYVKGVLVTSSQTQAPAGLRTDDSTSDFIIGNNASQSVTYDGNAQKVALVPTILTSTQIRILYESGIVDLIDRGYDKVIQNLSPAGYWRLGEGINTTVFDDSANTRDGSITGGIAVGQNAVVAQDPQTGMLFDGVGDFIPVGAVADFSFIQNTGVFTLFALVAITDHTADSLDTVLGNNSGLGTEKGFLFAYENRVSQSSPKNYVISLSNGTTNFSTLTGSINGISDNNVHSIVVTGDGTNSRLYIDGVLDSTSTAYGTLSTGDSTNVLSIGRGNVSTGFDMAGTLSRVGILTTTATPQQVLQMHEAFLSRFAAEAISKQPLSYWRFNEVSSNAINYGSDTTTGVVTGATQGDADTPLTNETPETTSYNFDGLSGDVDFGSPAALDDLFVGGGTILSFIKPDNTGESGGGRVFDKRGSSSTGWILLLNGGVGSEVFRFFKEFDTTNGDWRVPVGSITVNQFQFIGATYNANAAANIPKLYLDSLESIPSTADVQAVGVQQSGNLENLLIGNRPADDFTFDGEIAESMLFSTILPTVDILDIQEMSIFALIPFFGFKGDLTENFILEDWLLRAHRLDTGAFLGEAIVDIPTKKYSLDITASSFTGFCSLSMFPNVKNVWTPSTIVALNDYIIPTNPNSPSNFFKVTVAGTTGATEPTWVISGNTIDNTVTWADQGSLIRPKVQSPRLPSA